MIVLEKLTNKYAFVKVKSLEDRACWSGSHFKVNIYFLYSAIFSPTIFYKAVLSKNLSWHTVKLNDVYK